MTPAAPTTSTPATPTTSTPAVPTAPAGSPAPPVTAPAGVVDPIITPGVTSPSLFATLTATATAVDHLKQAPKPRFREGHKLQPLSTSGYWFLNSKAEVELVKNFGYAFRGASSSEFAQLEAKDPGKYKVFTEFNPLGTFFNNAAVGPDGQRYISKLSASPFLQDGKGNGDGVLSNPDDPKSARTLMLSPLISDADWLLIGRSEGAAMKARERGANISIVQNYGEYGPLPTHRRLLTQDPKVKAAQEASGLEWFAFLGREKARGERLLKKGFLEGLAQKTPPLYIYYTEGYGFPRGSYYQWKDYVLDYNEFAKDGFAVSDMPNDQTYYEQFNYGFTGASPIKALDMLTQLLNTIGGNRAMGDNRSMYLWSSAGWESQGKISEPDRYMGFLKVAYTVGAQSMAVGYFCNYAADSTNNWQCPNVVPEARTLAAMGPSPSQWLWPTMVHGHAHALFSHLEDHLNKSDLLSDGRKGSYDIYTVPTELLELSPENETRDLNEGIYPWKLVVPTARVVARKLKSEDRFLVTAWANTGEDRMVNVTVPGLGRVAVNARKSGAVYLASLVNGQPKLTLVDTNGMNPTASIATATP
jgi:hypothetical protein